MLESIIDTSDVIYSVSQYLETKDILNLFLNKNCTNDKICPLVRKIKLNYIPLDFNRYTHAKYNLSLLATKNLSPLQKYAHQIQCLKINKCNTPLNKYLIFI